jgi:hypothetical protein
VRAAHPVLRDPTPSYQRDRPGLARPLLYRSVNKPPYAVDFNPS